jgi:hypothetical protein
MNVEDDNVELLIGWLRGQPCSILHGKASKASIKRILDLHGTLVQVLAEIDQLPIWTRMEDDLPQLDPLIKELNERLALYAATPTFTLYDGRSWGINDALDTYHRIPVGESLAARSLCEIAYLRRLDRVRTCLCGTWFYAKRADQTSCSPTCRKNKHQQTEAFREKRRIYMRSYYRLKNSGRVK